MKKLLSVTLVVVFHQLTFSQVIKIANDNVGIGTKNPIQKLHVDGNTYLNGSLGIGGIEHPTIKLYVEGNSSFSGNGLFTGNVGIGTKNPIQKLHVVGNSYFNGNLGVGVTVPAQKLHVSGNGQFNGNGLFTGSVGIGTTMPTHTLHVNGTGLFNSTNKSENTVLQVVNNITNRNSESVLGINSMLTDNSQISGINIGINSFVTKCNNCPESYYGIGVHGSSDKHFINVGVLGDIGNNAFTDFNSSLNGIGIMGDGSGLYPGLSGRYAGFFVGDVLVNGTVNGIYLSGSDLFYKQEVSDLKKNESLGKLMQLRPVTYRLKQRYVQSLNISKETGKPEEVPLYDEKTDMFKNTHFGLIAQELQEIYPDLVYTNQEGYLAVNYVELIPVLIAAVNELRTEVETLRSERHTNDIKSDEAHTGSNTLPFNPVEAGSEPMQVYQNAPNPFNERTTVRCYIPQTVSSVQLCIYDMQGAQIKCLTISERGTVDVQIEAGALASGIYTYLLVASNGTTSEAKQMILTK